MPSHSGVEHDLFDATPPPPVRATASGAAVDLSDAAESEPPPPNDSVPPLFGLTHPAPTKRTAPAEDIDFLLGLQGSRGTTATLQSPTLADLAKRPPSEPPLPPVDVDLDIDDGLVPTRSKIATAPVQRDAPELERVARQALAPTATAPEPNAPRPPGIGASAASTAGHAAPALPLTPEPSAHAQAKSSKRPAALLALAALGLSGAVLASTVLTRPQAREEPSPSAPSTATAESGAHPATGTAARDPTSNATEPTNEGAEPTAATNADETPTARNPRATQPAPANVIATPKHADAPSTTRPRAEPTSTEPARTEPTRTEPAAPRTPITPRPSTPRAPVGAEFDRQAAVSTLTAQASQASSCRKDGDPSGTATVVITFAPSGRVTSANVNGPPFAGTQTGGCIAAAFRRARVPPFDGDNITVSKTVVIH